MQNRAVLGDVDALAAEHGVHALAQPTFVRQPQEQTQRLAREAVFRVVEVQTDRLEGETIAALGVVGEQLSQMDVTQGGLMRLQCPPGGPLGGEGHTSLSSLARNLQAFPAGPRWSWEDQPPTLCTR